ncbi:MAG TPA: HD domain-containing protein [Lacunisphaera sp.]|nr:HD domain-containing protein [Lacunisphaera sp.]
MVPPHTVNTKSSLAVAAMVKEALGDIGSKASFPLIDRLFADVTDMFEGRYPGYRAIDMFYHDFEHTLQATVCLTHILQGRSRSADKPVLKPRDWELAIMAVLLHDSGYLKETRDVEGTGAKYTIVHERRSCEFARQYLPRMGVTGSEIEDICSAIICTGPQSRISQITFHREEARIFAFILVTADYLAQMSAADYPDELPILYREFHEAYEFEKVPEEKRPYKSVEDLLRRTPNFWQNYVRPMLDFEAGGVHRYLATAGQPNPYLQAAEANIAEVQRRLQVGSG